MSNISLAKKLSDDKRQIIIRANRFDELSSTYGVCLRYDGQMIPVDNISETGIGLFSSTPLFEGLDLIPVELVTRDNALMFSGFGRVVRRQNVDDKFRFGIEFNGKSISRDFLKALDQLIAIELSVTKSQNEFLDIPLKLRELVFEIRCFFKALKGQVDDLEQRLEIESVETKESLINAFDVRFGPYVIGKLQEYGQRLAVFLDVTADKFLRKKCVNFFKEELNEYYLKSPYAKRAHLKPLGYAGDYEMMNQVYRNQYEGTTLFAKLMHKYTVNEAAALSVRERKKILGDVIMRETARGKGRNVKICCLASGPAQEIVDLIYKGFGTDCNVELYLVDQDVESLLDARRSISAALATSHASIRIHCLPISVKQLIEGSASAEEFMSNKFDLIYSAGLYDYLLQPIAKMLTTILLDLLSDKGSIFIGNFHPNSPTRAICEFSVDWRLVYRDEKDMLDLVVDTKNAKTFLDDKGIVAYLDYRKG